MLVLNERVSCWDERLKPIGEGDHVKEPFDQWWVRNAESMQNLDSKIAEQWVYRHWKNSPYCFIQLHALNWKLECWPTEPLLRNIHIRGWTLDPDFDYRQFQNAKRFANHPTVTSIDQSGTWDYPIIVLETPNGFRDSNRSYSEEKYLLIEGHKRLRYLNAKHQREECMPCHQLFLLSIGRSSASFEYNRKPPARSAVNESSS
jgi:hypothetical protein